MAHVLENTCLPRATLHGVPPIAKELKADTSTSAEANSGTRKPTSRPLISSSPSAEQLEADLVRHLHAAPDRPVDEASPGGITDIRAAHVDPTLALC